MGETALLQRHVHLLIILHTVIVQSLYGYKHNAFLKSLRRSRGRDNFLGKVWADHCLQFTVQCCHSDRSKTSNVNILAKAFLHFFLMIPSNQRRGPTNGYYYNGTMYKSFQNGTSGAERERFMVNWKSSHFSSTL